MNELCWCRMEFLVRQGSGSRLLSSFKSKQFSINVLPIASNDEIDAAGRRVVQIVFDFRIKNYPSIGCAVRFVLKYLERPRIASPDNMPPAPKPG
jgi:hypothetical protein